MQLNTSGSEAASQLHGWREIMQIPECFIAKRLRRGTLGSIEQDEFLEIIIAFIHFAGGKAKRQIMISKIHEVYSNQFSGPDYQLLESQSPPKERWIHNIDWAKRKLVQQGLLLEPSKSPYGTWVLSELGRRSVEKLAK